MPLSLLLQQIIGTFMLVLDMQIDSIEYRYSLFILYNKVTMFCLFIVN